MRNQSYTLGRQYVALQKRGFKFEAVTTACTAIWAVELAAKPYRDGVRSLGPEEVKSVQSFLERIFDTTLDTSQVAILEAEQRDPRYIPF